MKDLLTAVVGNCAAGKTTLVNNLRRLGYRAINVPQEHSEVRRLWRYKHPDILILLSCTLATAQERRPTFAWTRKQLEEQYRRLRYAREECDLHIVTDPLSIDEVLERAVSLIEERRKEQRDERKKDSG